MKLISVHITDFRNLENISIDLNPNLNVVVGKNGSGKSSLLEAIHYLGYGRSFRTAKHSVVMQHGKDSFVVHGRVESADNGSTTSVGLRRSSGGELEISIGGNKGNKLFDLVRLFPVQIFTPQSSDLVLGSPSLRRKFLDWIVFHVEHSFNEISSSFGRAIKQRNALLKQLQKSPNLFEEKKSELDYWTRITADFGSKVHEARVEVFKRLESHLKRNFEQFVTEFSVEISYHRGWDSSEELYENLVSKIQTDIKYGFTSIGPQKCELVIKADKSAASEILSRGQLRMLVASMQLSQSEFLAEASGKQSIFLIDDVAAELDENKRHKFVEYLIACNSQIIVTAIALDQMSFLEKYKNKKVFHVEHGQLNEE